MHIKWRNPLSDPLIIFLLIFYTNSSQANKQRVQMKMLVSSKSLSMQHFKPGVAAEALPDAIYYNKYIPMIFQLKVPEWSTDTLRLNTSLHCTTDAIKPNFLCPVAFHMERLLAPLADSMRFAKNIYTPTEGWTYFGKFNCEQIESHFFHLSAHVDELHLYVDKIKSQCALARTISPIVKNMSVSASHHLVMANIRFNSHMDNTKDLYNDEYKMVHMAGFVGLQTAFILTKYIDTVRWNNAFTQCQNSRLSIGLVNSFWLRNALQPVQKIAESNGYKLSIPVHEYLPHYYKLPLTDCILGIQSTKKTTLMLRMLVPVKKKETKYTRFRLTKIPYLITEGSQKKICEIDSFDPNDDFLVEESSVPDTKPVVTIAPDCFETELCHIAEQPRRLVVDPCLKGLMNGSLNHIRDYCSFECYNIESEELLLPIIIKVANNQYSITGSHKTKPISVFCDGKLNQVLEPNKTNGVMQVVLPCNCELHHKSEIYKSSSPCTAPFEAHYLSSVPIKMILSSKAGSHPEEEKSEANADQELNEVNSKGENETLEIPEINVPAGWVLPAEIIEEEKVGPPQASHTLQLVLIWILLIILTLSNLILLYVVYQNRLFDLQAVRGILGRVGFGNRSLTRTRLEEETSSRNGNGTPQQSNVGTRGITPMPDNTLWPASLNQL